MCSIGLVKQAIQHNVSLALTNAIRGTFREKLYHELGFESLESRSWYHKLYYFYKVFKAQSPKYLFDLIQPKEPKLLEMMIRYLTSKQNNYFKSSCFPSAANEWNKNLLIRILPKFSFMEETS